MKQKIFALFTALCLALTLLPTAALAKPVATWESEPTATANMVYEGKDEAWELIEAGTSECDSCTVQYRMQGETEWGTQIPKGTDAGEYKVECRIQGCNHHADSEIKTVTATIDQHPVLVQIGLEGNLEKTYGQADPDIPFTLRDDSGGGGLDDEIQNVVKVTFQREEGEDAEGLYGKKYKISVKSFDGGKNFKQGTTYDAYLLIYPVNLSDYNNSVGGNAVQVSDQMLTADDEGKFKEPVLPKIVNDEPPAGNFKYTLIGKDDVTHNNVSYEEAVAIVKEFTAADDAVMINYRFEGTGNYTGGFDGAFGVVIRDIAFRVDGAAATESNALTLMTDTSYGATWGERVQLKEGVTITATANGQTVAGRYYIGPYYERLGEGEAVDSATFAAGRPGVVTDESIRNLCTVYFTSTDETYKDEIVIPAVEVPVTQKKLTVTGLKARDKDYDGKVSANVTGTAQLTGVVSGETVEFTCDSWHFADKNVGKGKKVTGEMRLTGDTAGNYKIDEDIGLTADIIAVEVILGLVAADRPYNGTKDVTVTVDSLGGKIDGDDLGISYTSATVESADAGSKPVTITGLKLTGNDAKNYTLIFNSAVRVTISKLEYDGTKNFSRTTKAGKSEEIDLSEYIMPGGDVSVDVSGLSSMLDGTPQINDGKLTYQIKPKDQQTSWGEGSQCTIKVGVEKCTNYNGYQLIVTVTASVLEVPTLSARDITVTYNGEAIPASKITGTAKFEGKNVTGEWSWTNADSVPTNVADSSKHSVTFTPEDSSTYATATVEIDVTINPAKLPALTLGKISMADSTLHDVSVSWAGKADGDGFTFRWADSLDTVVERGKAYSYTFTHESGNYEEKTGSHKPYSGASSGNGSGGSGGSSSTETVKPEETSGNVTAFTDVKESDYFYDAVKWAAANGITEGNSATTFGSHDSCTRAQLVTLLYRVAGQPESTGESGMRDVDASAYYAAAVAWAVERGIVNGYGDGVFGSADTITREQMAVILYRFAQAAGMDTTQGGMAVREYADYESISAYAVEAMQWAVNAGVMEGYGGNLSPKAPCTRAQIVTMLYRLLGK